MTNSIPTPTPAGSGTAEPVNESETVNAALARESLPTRVYDQLMSDGRRGLADEFADANGIVQPALQHRLAELTTMLDEYDEGHPPAGEGAAAEVSAVGPIIDAVRALIKDLS